MKETAEVVPPTPKPLSEVVGDESVASARAIIKYKALYNGIRVFQSAAIFAGTTPFNFTDMMDKTAIAVNKSAMKDGKVASLIECHATIVDSRDREGSEVELDVEDDQDWEVISSIVKEWWTTQRKRHIVINVDVKYS